VFVAFPIIKTKKARAAKSHASGVDATSAYFVVDSLLTCSDARAVQRPYSGHCCYDRLVSRFSVSPFGDMAGLMVTFTLSRVASSILRMSSSNSSATLSTTYTQNAHRIDRHVGKGAGARCGCIYIIRVSLAAGLGRRRGRIRGAKKPKEVPQRRSCLHKQSMSAPIR